MKKLREALKGKKTYLAAAIGVLGALIAYADGQIDGTSLVAALWAAGQSIFIHAAVARKANGG